MRILVTGGTGFIGSHTIRALLSAGHDVKLLVRNEEKARRLWADEPGCSRIWSSASSPPAPRPPTHCASATA
ncbi:MAG: NAD(P)-dependent oxidoreductase [Myxococcota bacterium]